MLFGGIAKVVGMGASFFLPGVLVTCLNFWPRDARIGSMFAGAFLEALLAVVFVLDVEGLCLGLRQPSEIS